MLDRDGRWKTPGRAVATALSSLIVGLGCAACASGSSAGTPGSSPSGSASYQELTRAFLQYAQCARSHGMPDLPDPVVDQQGNDTYPSLSAAGSWRWPASVLTGCASVWTHVYEVRARYDASHGLGARPNSTLSAAQALAFSRCVRLHGFPNFPDPGPNGAVAELPPGWSKPNLSDAARTAILACQGAPHE